MLSNDADFRFNDDRSSFKARPHRCPHSFPTMILVPDRDIDRADDCALDYGLTSSCIELNIQA